MANCNNTQYRFQLQEWLRATRTAQKTIRTKLLASQKTMRLWLKGCLPSNAEITTIAEILGIDPKELFVDPADVAARDRVLGLPDKNFLTFRRLEWLRVPEDDQPQSDGEKAISALIARYAQLNQTVQSGSVKPD